MTKIRKLAKLTAFLMALVMLLGSFPGRYNVTIAYSEDGTNVTETSELSEEEQEAVRKAAEEMGYVPNAAARALKTSRSSPPRPRRWA